MAIPSPATAPALLTEADALERVRQLVGPALVRRRLWAMWVDGDGRQLPELLQIDDFDRTPDVSALRNLGQVLAGTLVGTDLGPGSVILTLERSGPSLDSSDARWSEALRTMAAEAGVPLLGVFLSFDEGVRAL